MARYSLQHHPQHKRLHLSLACRAFQFNRRNWMGSPSPCSDLLKVIQSDSSGWALPNYSITYLIKNRLIGSVDSPRQCSPAIALYSSSHICSAQVQSQGIALRPRIVRVKFHLKTTVFWPHVLPVVRILSSPQQLSPRITRSQLNETLF